ncbi:MAG: guanylate kinase [Ruminococcus sp.]|nr:guanylate kinase [Ruminococcus sp.]
MNKGRLIVFSAPSGCGKGTMLAEITKDKNYRCSISATTRNPRPGDVDGVTYYFLTNEEFEDKMDRGEFLEYAGYCDHYYGTFLTEVDPYLEQGINVILEIEVKGAMKVREKRPEALMIFVVPPSLKELRRRLEKRGTESPETIEKRLEEAENEIPMAIKYDYVIVNDALEDAVDDFFKVMETEKLKAENSHELIGKILDTK